MTQVSPTKEIEVQFIFDFQTSEEVYFAMTYPYTVDDLKRDVMIWDSKYLNHPSIYYKRELLVKSNEKRRVDLITISSHSLDSKKNEERVHSELFPEYGTDGGPCKRFESNKLIVFLTSRVHPGETPASYAIKGSIEFLLNETDPLAAILRNLFVFKIVPMINPDGVSRGHFRTDGFGKNLNRYYRDANPVEQPAVFAICQLINYFELDKRIFFFCDYHAHGSYKNHFFYGNSLGFLMQVESRAFARLFELNNPSFSYDCCDFSQRQMAAKENNPLEKEKRTKEHCSRVATYRYAHLIHSFTLELGYHQVKSKDNTRGPIYNTMSFEIMGKDLLISLLDLFEKNPSSIVSTSKYTSLANIRKEIAEQIKKSFRKRQVGIKRLANNVHEMIEEEYYEEIKKKLGMDQKIGLKQVSKSVAPVSTKIEDNMTSPISNHTRNRKIIRDKTVREKPYSDIAENTKVEEKQPPKEFLKEGKTIAQVFSSIKTQEITSRSFCADKEIFLNMETVSDLVSDTNWYNRSTKGVNSGFRIFNRPSRAFDPSEVLLSLISQSKTSTHKSSQAVFKKPEDLLKNTLPTSLATGRLQVASKETSQDSNARTEFYNWKIKANQNFPTLSSIVSAEKVMKTSLQHVPANSKHTSRINQPLKPIAEKEARGQALQPARGFFVKAGLKEQLADGGMSPFERQLQRVVLDQDNPFMPKELQKSLLPSEKTRPSPMVPKKLPPFLVEETLVYSRQRPGQLRRIQPAR